MHEDTHSNSCDFSVAGIFVPAFGQCVLLLVLYPFYFFLFVSETFDQLFICMDGNRISQFVPAMERQLGKACFF